jgi:hypothetical protein
VLAFMATLAYDAGSIALGGGLLEDPTGMSAAMVEASRSTREPKGATVKPDASAAMTTIIRSGRGQPPRAA